MAKRAGALKLILLLGLLPLFGAGIAVQPASAELPSTDSRSLAENRTSRDGTKPSDLNALAADERETEKIVLDLVQTHLPELTNVLKRLRSDQPREYQLAIKDLAKSARKLELAQIRDQRLFEIELELFQAEQQASLLMAKLKVRDNQADRKRLREVAQRLQQAQIARAQYDVDLFRQRLARAQQQLDGAVARLDSRKDHADEQLERSYQTMLRKAGRESNKVDVTAPPSKVRSDHQTPESRGTESHGSQSPSPTPN